MSSPIYLDNHATTRVDPRVLEAMLPYFCEHYGNAASRTHAFGWKAEAAVEQARAQVAQLISASSKDLVFTSGATEANNLAIKGAAAAYRVKGRHLVTVSTEHKSVLDPCEHLEREGWSVTKLGVDPEGLVSIAAVEAALTDETVLVSVMAANNEIGVLQPLAEIGDLCRRRGILFHTDAAQAAGKIPLDVDAMSLDLLSMSAHKVYGPKGVGALYVRRNRPRVRLEPLADGGGHERGLRSGTLDVAGIVGFGAAAALAAAEMAAEASRLLALRERLYQGILERAGGVKLNGHPSRRLPGNLNVSFESIDGEALIAALPDLAVSSGSACTSASLEPSHVLLALGVGREMAHSSLRFGLGRFNTPDEIERAVERVAGAVQRLRTLAAA